MDNENRRNAPKRGFIKRHPILFNAVLIFAAFCAFVYLSMVLIDIFTEHGSYVVVPEIKNLPLSEAVAKLDEAGFKYEVADSIYEEKVKPGMVVDQVPKGNSKVKSHRTVYITINAFAPKMVTFPNIQEISVRQAQAVLESLGLKNVRIDTVYSPFRGLVIATKMNGLPINPGTRIPASAVITLEIGDGAENLLPDSVPPTPAEGSADGEHVRGDNSVSNVDFM